MEDKKHNITRALFLIIVLIAGYLLFRRVVDYRQTLHNITLEKITIEELHKNHLYKKELEKKTDEFNALLEDYKKMIPETPKEDTIIESLADIAENRGIKLNQIQFGQRKDGERLAQIPFSISLAGEYFDLLDLLDDMRNNYRIMNINNIALRRADEITGDIVIDMTLEAFHKKR